MPRCTRSGCGQDFNTEENALESCVYHPGAPVFHEGLKSWSCCADVNKPVMEFDAFLAIPGCARGIHSAEAPLVAAPKSTPSANANITSTRAPDGTETFVSKPAQTSGLRSLTGTPLSAEPTPIVQEEEDLNAVVPLGTKCLHIMCSTTFVSDEVNRLGDGEGTICTYHPAPPIFHEGSKGYLCCKRRVLEFDEFLKIQGCKKGRHLFVPKTSAAPTEEEMVDCRIDHYQTPTEIHLSVYAKQVDRARSKVQFDDEHVAFDFYLPSAKRFRKTVNLFGPIDASASTAKFYGTKVEVTLKKLDTRSWTILEKPTTDLGDVRFTFGVSGRVGTIGGKALVLDETNTSRT